MDETIPLTLGTIWTQIQTLQLLLKSVMTLLEELSSSHKELKAELGNIRQELAAMESRLSNSNQGGKKKRKLEMTDEELENYFISLNN